MRIVLKPTLLSILAAASVLFAGITAASQTLVSVDSKDITLADLETALASSPFYTQFNTLGETEQAAMRGDMLKRLVTAKLLETEARRLKMEQSPEFAREMEDYLDGVRFQKYQQGIKYRVAISDQEKRDLRRENADSSDDYAAALSILTTRRYQALYQLTLQQLRDQYPVNLYPERITESLQPDTVLAEGETFQVRYADLSPGPQADDDASAILKRLYDQLEYQLVVMAARAEPVDVSKEKQRYIEQRLPSLLLDAKIRQWVPDEDTLRRYFESRPQLHRLKDWWHIGQLVVSSREQAEALREKIISGENSLFQLAEKYSIDPAARTNSGDLGWVLQGSGLPEIEAAIQSLQNNEVSPVIKTDKGYHLVVVINRRTGSPQYFSQIKDKLKQMMISNQLQQYLADLQKRHKVVWQVMESDQRKAHAILNKN